VTELPRFADLPVRPGAPRGSTWGLWGDDDEIGTLNLIGPDQVRAAAALVRRGSVFSLNWDLTQPAPPFFGRATLRHTILAKYEGVAVDDFVDGFWPQASSQWDGLRHFADAEHGFYNGASLEDVTAPGPGRLGMEHWARRGIATRGVLIDVARVLERDGVGCDPFDFHPIGPSLLARTAAEQDVALRTGDILVIRTGWIEAYERLSGEARIALAEEGRPGSPGLYGDDVPAFLWDAGMAAVAADNPALEAGRRGTGSDLALHKALLARLGMPLGELWDVQHLARDCAQDGVYEFLLTSAPLVIPGGAGSPPNVLALK
jgi:Putative cyclase